VEGSLDGERKKKVGETKRHVHYFPNVKTALVILKSKRLFRFQENKRVLAVGEGNANSTREFT